MKPVLVSGIQPTGRLHMGNYLGALKNFVDLQNSGKYECYFFIADLHSITETFDPKKKHDQIVELTADFLAAGIDPKKSVLFQQSQVPAHGEFLWILSAITPMGELERMTQFKDKSRRQVENINAGLFYYPVLMAADILLYGPGFVPVGEDQEQHLELTRELARKFNAKFGDTLREPKALFTRAKRVMSLTMPGAKMSKSDVGGCLFIDDDPETIMAKIKGATTDSHASVEYEPNTRPGMGNLLDIYSALSDKEPKAVAGEFAGKNYSDFKKALSELVANYFSDFREKKKALLANPKSLIATLKAGSEKAAKVAEKKMAEVKRKVGLAI